MDINIDPEKLKNLSLFIAVPAYGNIVTLNFASSLVLLSNRLRDFGIVHELAVIGNESLVTRGRNVLSNNFYRSTHSHLLFLDADLSFDADDILAMLFMDKEIIGLPYSKKSLDWERTAEAIKAGVEPKDLPNISAAVVVNWADTKAFECDKPVEVRHLGTGLMLISRDVFTKLDAAHPEWTYNLMDDEQKKYSTKTFVAFFDTGIDPKTGWYLSEDYKFCNDWRELGGSVWMLPWAKTTHQGSYGFKCDLTAIAAAGVKL